METKGSGHDGLGPIGDRVARLLVVERWIEHDATIHLEDELWIRKQLSRRDIGAVVENLEMGEMRQEFDQVFA